MGAMTKVHRVAGLRISRVEFVPREVSRLECLPELEPPEDRLRQSRAQIFGPRSSIRLSHGSAVEDVFEPKRRPEHDSLVARLTVYVMTLIVLVMSMPVGLGLLFFNIIGGENIRTTAHVMALTGMGIALAGTPEGARLLSYLM